MLITRRVEFDAGHRIPDHKSKCRNAHGHRYVLEATVRGEVNLQEGESDTGMVVDFGDLKEIMTRHICDLWDHAFLVYRDDIEMRAALERLGPDHRTVVCRFIPTVENMAKEVFDTLDYWIGFRGGSRFRLYHVRLYETPNCWADVYADDINHR